MKNFVKSFFTCFLFWNFTLPNTPQKDSLLLRELNDLKTEVYIHPYKYANAIDSINKIYKPKVERESEVVLNTIYGEIFYNVGNYANALKYFTVAFNTAKDYEIWDRASIISTTRSELMFFLGEEEKSLQLLDTAYYYGLKAKDTLAMVDAKIQKAINYGDQNKIEKSLDILNEVQNDVIKLKDSLISLMYEYVAFGSNLRLENYKTALEHYKNIEDDLSLRQKDNYEYVYLNTNLELTNTYLSERKIDSAAIFYHKIDSNKQINFDAIIRKYYLETGIELYNQLGDTKNVSIYLDSLSQINENLGILNEKLDIKEKLEEEAEKEQILFEKQNQQKLYLVYVFISILLLGVIIFLFRKNKKTSKKTIDTYNTTLKNLKAKVKDSSKLKAKLQDKNKRILNLKKELQDITSIKDPKEQRERIYSLYKQLVINTNQTNQSFEVLFNEVKQLNTLFFDRIIKIEQPLTNEEQLICFYINSGLKNSEIAFLLSLSTRAVESKRYRITKKIRQIPGFEKTSIVDFLQEEICPQETLSV